jgi:hypothetical protein
MTAVTAPIPLPARWLGFGGLVPFVTLAGASLLDPAHAERWSFALLAYAAVILSFVGALHWGFATLWQSSSPECRARLMGWSVVPALGAWISLLLTTGMGLGLLCVLFVAHYLRDVQLARTHELPDWYLRLRLRLTVGAVPCLAGVAIVL